MIRTSPTERRRLSSLARPEIEAHQLVRLNRLLTEILPANRFYAEKFAGRKFPLSSLAELASLPTTRKHELIDPACESSFARNLTWPVESYVRFHRTSGTHGRPLAVLDTADDWKWWLDVWQYVFDAAEVTAADRVLMAFSFGPFIGFWSAFDAAVARGCLTIPTGGMDTAGRIDLIRTTRATVIFATPTYALRMAEVAASTGVDLRQLGVRNIVVAGEPGGSVPATRERIETSWNAKLYDHAGASEIGPWGLSDTRQRGLFVNEAEFIAEFLQLESDQPAVEGELAELVLTNLGRPGSPLIRYRTGDLVRPNFNAEGDVRFVLLERGVIGRADDMLIVRGVNIFPSSIEQIMRQFPEVVEYRLTARKNGTLDELSIEIEGRLQSPVRVAEALRVQLGLRVDVALVPDGSLPRFEAKGKRFIDLR